jgi:hypothetical protein
MVRNKCLKTPKGLSETTNRKTHNSMAKKEGQIHKQSSIKPHQYVCYIINKMNTGQKNQSTSTNKPIGQTYCKFSKGLGLLCLTPLSTIFQL